MAIVLASYLLLFIFTFSAQTSNGAILLSSLPNTLEVAASQLKANQVTSPNGTWYTSNEIIAGEDRLGVLWYLNSTFPAGTDASYKNVKVKLCYVPESQVGMPSRKTDDDLAKDKTCQFQFAERPYNASSNWSYFESTLDPRVPPASYFVRVYAYGSEGVEVAYGQNTDADVSYNRFEVISPGGNSWIDNQSGSKEKSTIDIATICFSCALSLVGFFFLSKIIFYTTKCI